MENSFRMSLFMPPISPIKDKATGRIVKNATLTPLRTVELSEVYKLVTANAKLAALTLAVRNAVQQGDDSVCRLLKQQTLPYVTPCGVFTRRRSDCIEETSGLVVVDVDHLESNEEAKKTAPTTIRRSLSIPRVSVHQSHRKGRESLRTLRTRTKRHRWNPLGDELCTLHVRHRPPEFG